MTPIVCTDLDNLILLISIEEKQLLSSVWTEFDNLMLLYFPKLFRNVILVNFGDDGKTTLPTSYILEPGSNTTDSRFLHSQNVREPMHSTDAGMKIELMLKHWKT